MFVIKIMFELISLHVYAQSINLLYNVDKVSLKK